MGESASIPGTPASLWHNRSFLRLWFAQVVSNAGSQITHLALPLTAMLVLVGQVITGAGGTIWSVNQMSLRQRLTPTHLLGRVTAARRFLLFSAVPVGSLLGGSLGEAIGLRATLAVGALGVIAALTILLVSPVRAVRTPSDALGGG